MVPLRQYRSKPIACRPQQHPPLPHPGWGVFQSEEVCCAPGAAFPEGCTAAAPPAAAAVAAATPAAAAAAPQAAG
jgi:hypothetical protein